jgi:hypothetical protein
MLFWIWTLHFYQLSIFLLSHQVRNIHYGSAVLIVNLVLLIVQTPENGNKYRNNCEYKATVKGLFFQNVPGDHKEDRYYLLNWHKGTQNFSDLEATLILRYRLSVRRVANKDSTLNPLTPIKEATTVYILLQTDTQGPVTQ